MNYCPECGSKLEKDTLFCPNCGHKLDLEPLISPPSTFSHPTQYSTPPVYSQYQKPDNTKGIIALVFGILGFTLLPFIGNIVAIILGSLSRSQEEDSSLGSIGILLGILGLLCWIIFFIVLFSWIFSIIGTYPYYI